MAKDEKDLEGDDEAKAGGSKKKLLIIIGGVVLLLLIGVGAALFLMGGDEESAAEGTDAATAEAEPVVLPDPLYYAFKEQFVVSLPPGGRARMLQTNLQLMSRDQAVIDYVSRNAPMLRHHLFNLFSAADSSALYGRDGREALATAIKDKLNELIKEHGLETEVESVYFTELVLQ